MLGQPVAGRSGRGRGTLELGRDERLDVLTADAGYHGEHALTGEKRCQERAVIGGGADGPGRQVRRLQMESPGRQEYGKLSYAGTGIDLSQKVRLDAVPAVCRTSVRG